MAGWAFGSALWTAPVVAQTPRDIATHVCQRVTFGPTFDLVDRMVNGGLSPSSYITRQLQVSAPANDPSADMQALVQQLKALGFLPSAPGVAVAGPGIGLPASGLFRAAYAEFQLNELMTRFWNDHFNRDWSHLRFAAPFVPVGDSMATWYMMQDDDFYRDHALGSFADLLVHTAGSPSMLLYLDNYKSTATDLNENWGRELIELFTMGPDNLTAGTPNYNQQDVVDVARCFTGWTVLGTGAATVAGFVAANHDTTAKNLFATTGHSLAIAAGGTPQFDGDRVLRHLAGLDATADNIVRKLMIQFLADDAPQRYPLLLRRAKQVWGPAGDIRAVLTVLLQSTEFLSAVDRWKKVKNPFRYNVSMLRAMGARATLTGALAISTGYASLESTSGMGQTLYGFPSPDGYPLTNPKQHGVGGYLDRVSSAERVLQESTDVFAGFHGLFDVEFDPSALVLAQMPAAAQTNSGQVAAFLLTHFFADKVLNPGDAGIVAFEMGTLPNPATAPLAYANAIRQGCEILCSFTHFALH